jgi:hypothetical protein
VRVSVKAWEVIRRLAFKSNLPMSSIVDELLAHSTSVRLISEQIHLVGGC